MRALLEFMLEFVVFKGTPFLRGEFDAFGIMTLSCEVFTDLDDSAFQVI